MNLDAILDELADRVAARILEKLSAAPSFYGTGKGATLPPGKTRAWALRNIRTIPGARKVGRDWIVSISDFDAWATERDSERQRNASRRNMPRKSHDDLRHANDARQSVEALARIGAERAGFRVAG